MSLRHYPIKSQRNPTAIPNQSSPRSQKKMVKKKRAKIPRIAEVTAGVVAPVVRTMAKAVMALAAIPAVRTVVREEVRETARAEAVAMALAAEPRTTPKSQNPLLKMMAGHANLEVKKLWSS